MTTPSHWLPFAGEKGSRRTLVFVVALVLSLSVHVALPFLRLPGPQAVRENTLTMEILPPPPIPLPEADELVPSPHEDDVDAPELPEKPAQDTEKVDALEKDSPAMAEKAVEAAKEPDEPPQEPQTEAVGDAPPAPEATPTDDAALAAEREKRKAALQERLARLRAEREARRKAKEKSGGKAGGAPDSGDWQTGKPDAVWLCNANNRGEEIHVTAERPLSQWVFIVPTALSGISSKPNMGDYLGDITQVVKRDRKKLKRMGFVEMALPQTSLHLYLDKPGGMRLALGRNDARCLIGFRYANGLFPFTLRSVPVRFIDAKKPEVSAVVDITVYKDASLDIVAVDGTAIPVKSAALRNSRAIARNIQDHFQAAKLAKSIADIFGIQLGTNSAPKKKKK